MERDEWERACLEERVAGEEARVEVEGMRREVEGSRERMGRVESELEGEREKVANLQGVLEDFQAGEWVPILPDFGQVFGATRLHSRLCLRHDGWCHKFHLGELCWTGSVVSFTALVPPCAHFSSTQHSLPRQRRFA